MITHRLRSLHILIHDEYRTTEKLSTGLRNVRLLVRPQLVSTAPVLWQWVSGAGRGGAASPPFIVAQSRRHSFVLPALLQRAVRVFSRRTRTSTRENSRTHAWAEPRQRLGG